MTPIFKPYMPSNIMSGLEDLLYSSKLSYGHYGVEFENKLSEFIGNPYVLTISNYNQAMLVVLSLLGCKEGDEIIASPVSCLASNQPFVVKGLKVVWADVEPDTGALCIDDVRQKITTKTKAIFHNHFCGYIGYIDELNQLAKQHGLWVVDDCIEAFGSQYKNQYMGNVGTDLTVFSFQTVRLPNTIDGAAITFKSKALYEKAKIIRDYGINRENFRLKNGEINPECDIHLEGYGATMNEISSFIGLKQMSDLPSLLQKQSHNADIWNDKLEKLTGVQPLVINKDSQPNFWVYGVLCDNKSEALLFFREQNYYSSSVHINNDIYSVFGKSESLKGVDEFMLKFLALPCGWWMNE